MKHEAIRKVHPNVVTINGDEWGKLQAWDKNGEDVAINQAAVDTEEVGLVAAHIASLAAKPGHISSAKEKLEALGLTVDEIKDLFGM